MNLQEQIFRSRKLMTENNQERMLLIQDMLNDMLSFDGNIEYKVVEEDVSDETINFSVEITIDSSMYHMISPNYNPKYFKYIEIINISIDKLIKNYFNGEVQYEVSVYFHKNVDKVISIAKPMLDKTMKVYSKNKGYPILKYKFLSTLRKPELIIFFVYDVEKGEKFSHIGFKETLNDLYYTTRRDGLFDDFYTTGIFNLTRDVNKIYESVENKKVVCDRCGWSWDLSDGGKDPYTCHKCGNINKPQSN